MTKHVYLCENSVDGIFTSIYDAWASNYGHSNNEIQVQTDHFNTQLFCDYISVTTDFEKAKKVAKTIQKKVSPIAYDLILSASSSYDISKADSIYRFIILGLHMGNQVMQHMSNDSVTHILNLQKNVGNEIMHYNGFLRFVELNDGVMLAKFQPKNDIIRYLAEHFSDRFPSENFIIADTTRNSLIVHPKNQEYAYSSMADFDLDSIEEHYSEHEQLFQDLWTNFTRTICIQPRVNLKLQQQMLPLHFRTYMPEFKKD